MKSKSIAVALLLSLLFLSITASSDGISSTSVGVHTFDNLDTDTLVSDGYISITNQENVTISVSLSTFTDLKIQDLNVTTKEPRTHSVNETVLFHQAPKNNWISYEENPTTISPLSTKKVHYELKIPTSELPSYISPKDGMLFYIHIHSQQHDTTTSSASIGEDYDFKVFTIFTTNLPEPSLLLPLSYILLFSLITSISLIYINNKYNIIKKIKERRLKQ